MNRYKNEQIENKKVIIRRLEQLLELLVLAAMFSLIVLAAIASVGSVFAARWWWKTRALRKLWREMKAAAQAASGPASAARQADAASPREPGDFIDGEFVREPDGLNGRRLGPQLH